MDKYIHTDSGIFSHHDAATDALLKLVGKGISQNRLKLFERNLTLPNSPQQTKFNEVLKDMVLNGAIGAAVGTWSRCISRDWISSVHARLLCN